MATAVPRDEWLEAEEYVYRSSYWQYLVERWLWQVPSAVPPRPVELSAAGRETPTLEALQDNAWVLVPESQISH